jgi:uncharacterized SAM-binding protein YcdF (DUF218 family)
MDKIILPLKALLKKIITFTKWFVSILGLLFSLMIVLSFTHIPFWAYYGLGTKGGNLESSPDYIVLMGNAGMPSPEGLLKCYCTAKKSFEFPNTKIIVALPGDTNSINHGDLFKIKNELTLRGIDSLRIIFEHQGINTHQQAENIAGIIDNKKAKILMVTTPDHMYRSIKTFQKAGFAQVGGNATFAKDIAPELLQPGKQEKKQIKNLNLRYNVWNYFKYQITVLREYTAIAYYKTKGWI